MVEDPHLAVHLAHFGIDVMSMQKVCENNPHNSDRISLEFLYLIFVRALQWDF